MATDWFTRADGVQLRVVPGFRERVLAMPRTAVRPTVAWDDDDFAAAAAERVRRIDKMLDRAVRRGLRLEAARMLEIGCGPGIDALIVAARAPAAEVVGIDLDLPLFDPSPAGDRPRRLAGAVCSQLGLGGALESVLRELPLRLERASATALPYEAGSFDFCWSDAVLEHVSSVDTCFVEMSRVLKPSGLAFHKIDPYFWLKGCHRRGLIDLPWAHARLEVDEIVTLARSLHGRSFARRCRARLEELNHYSVDAWRKVIDAAPLVVSDWHTASSQFAQDVLAEFPDVEQTLSPGVSPSDLVESVVRVWLAAS